ncbi:mechanosensitive ion channel [Ancylomarina sp. 16SWW S1-10-2]|uniref:mechanosensitive ion channel n=1 Tax=Ancylomarina sp. 16SWW S1-10-2 TaxID=2499681 RepID=UPI0012AE3A94|nr:mechanosensitive ion channel [Ancylomarina sp. 16SWW S1-10-2]MRT94015.1 hypothetical protein [Ancylomarina sp. 16SWW S1-10-2]
MEYIGNLLEPLMGKVGTLLPGVLGALVTLIIGWLIALLIKRAIYSILHKMKLDEKINKEGKNKLKLERGLSKLVYYLVMLYVVLLVLNIMGIKEALAPLNMMLNDFLSFVPNLIGAIIIAFAGYVIARIVSELIGLVASPIEKATLKLGFTKDIDLVNIIKQILFLFIFIPILIVALDALKMEVISAPATEMLQTFLLAIPKIIGGIIILAVFYIVAKFIVPVLQSLLANLGFDKLSEKMGLNKIIGQDSSISKMIGNIVFFFIMFAGIISSLEIMEFTSLVDILSRLMTLMGQIFFGLIILAIGNFIAKLVYKALSGSEGTKGIAGIAQFATIMLFLAIGLRSMGIANDIINLAFGLILGAIAVAVALSFGLGGREAAGKQMEHILKKFRKDD